MAGAACRIRKVVEAKTANGTHLTLRRPDGYTNAAQMIISLDRQPIGFLSTVDEDKPLELPKLTPGRHFVQALQVWLYHTEPSGIKSEVARGLQAETEFESTGKNILRSIFDSTATHWQSESRSCPSPQNIRSPEKAVNLHSER